MEIQDINEFLGYLEKVRQRTESVVACITAEALEWSPGAGSFTPGDLVRHIAGAERWMWAENVMGRPSRYPGHTPELASGLDAVGEYMRTLHAQAVEIFQALTLEQLQAKCPTVGGIELRTWKWLRAMVEHEIHHRGQLYTTLRLAGVETPSLYGLSEPEVRERSAPDQ
jgi:uncharacterized damage-inducible protein DinB